MFYIFIEDNKINGAGQVRILNEEIINFEVDESLYNAFVESPDMYIWEGTEVVVDPEYESKKDKKERERRNQEIHQKISELEQMAISDVLQGNKENVNTYNQVITSLRENLVMGY